MSEGRRMLAVSLMTFVAVLSVWAGDENYYYYYATADAAPTGAGKVYLSTDPQEEEPQYTEGTSEIQFYEYGSSYSYVYGYAQPAEGYLLAGWGTTEELVEVTGNPAMLPVESVTSDAGEPSDVFYPFEPDAVYKALFTRVKVSYASGQSNLGYVSCSKVCNEIGDEVVLTATPADEQCRFAYWTLNGEKISENPLTVTVTGPAEYVAHFESDYAFTLQFPEEGGYIPFSYPLDVAIPMDVRVCRVLCYTLDDNPVQSGQVVLSESFYSLTKNEGCLLYGAGEQTIVVDDWEYSETDEADLLRASGEDGTDISTLPQDGYRYYTFDGEKFVHVTSGIVDAHSAYLAVPDSCGTTAEELAIVRESDVDGIETVKADKTGQKVTGVYDLAGRRVAMPVKKGVYIIDGKKVWVR